MDDCKGVRDICFYASIFVAPKLQPQNRTCKPGAILSAISRRDISQGFRACLKLDCYSFGWI